MDKYIIREISPDCMDIDFYFDNDGFKTAGGDFNYCLFPVVDCNHCYYNAEEFKTVENEYNSIACEVDDIVNGSNIYYRNIKELMLDYNIPYNPRAAHALRVLCENESRLDFAETIAAFLSIKTGEKWSIKAGRGYCQGDFVDMIYCEKHYTKESIDAITDIYLGCAKEFCVIESEDETIYGFFVADSAIKDWRNSDNEYKKIVCEDAGLNPDNVTLEMIESSRTYTAYTYRAV